MGDWMRSNTQSQAGNRIGELPAPPIEPQRPPRPRTVRTGVGEPTRGGSSTPTHRDTLPAQPEERFKWLQLCAPEQDSERIADALAAVRDPDRTEQDRNRAVALLYRTLKPTILANTNTRARRQRQSTEEAFEEIDTAALGLIIATPATNAPVFVSYAARVLYYATLGSRRRAVDIVSADDLLYSGGIGAGNSRTFGEVTGSDDGIGAAARTHRRADESLAVTYVVAVGEAWADDVMQVLEATIAESCPVPHHRTMLYAYFGLREYAGKPAGSVTRAAAIGGVTRQRLGELLRRVRRHLYERLGLEPDDYDTIEEGL